MTRPRKALAAPVQPPAKSKLPALGPPKDPNALRLVERPGVSHDRMYADMTTQGVVANASLVRSFSANTTGQIGITEAVESLGASIASVQDGNLGAADALLMSQAVALNAMWSELARRAAVNMGEYPAAFESYMRLALKAQSQCRATLETLAMVKNPSVIFTRQANINNGGQQQVNNGTAPAGGNPASAPDELFQAKGIQHDNAMDAGAAPAPGRRDREMEAVGEVNGPANTRRQGQEREEQRPRRRAASAASPPPPRPRSHRSAPAGTGKVAAMKTTRPATRATGGRP